MGHTERENEKNDKKNIVQKKWSSELAKGQIMVEKTGIDLIKIMQHFRIALARVALKNIWDHSNQIHRKKAEILKFNWKLCRWIGFTTLS